MGWYYQEEDWACHQELELNVGVTTSLMRLDGGILTKIDLSWRVDDISISIRYYIPIICHIIFPACTETPIWDLLALHSTKT